ncbi:citrate synthase [Kibdelosporangium phytohabitans]|uniref:citrate synthase (unknown stereospecificity) n=1 Tax=Kibdelosporangium phytohabitans TaxID=860235 RepID=A0A0N9HVZ5_9PSEU|nr:citrate synthase [Kibdelosporangium phytohabitans]ALG09358.1 excisionase [Kibdelosporangium phytohabitans]MBE1469376.1 citrate synthase [Kibdelosporangium phytohabitans]
MAEASDERYLSTAEVARQLGVKPETVYAYVSRGQLASTRATGRRGSVFRQEDVDQLAARGRDARRPSGPLAGIRTDLTLLEDDALYYRGHRATDLAVSHAAESVAGLLWTGELAGQPFPAPPDMVALAKSSVGVLPPSARLTDQLRVAVATLGCADPMRFDLSASAIVTAARTLIGTLVDAIGSAEADSLAARLWPALGAAEANPELLNAALVLLADHDLAVSTVAARVAASAHAHLYAVISAGLGAVDGHYHGAASTLAHRFLADALVDPMAALSEQLRTGTTVPGFGHRFYENRDPRADLLLDLLRRVPRAAPVLSVVDTVVGELRRGRGGFPNVDLALAAVMHTYDMRPDAGEAIFAVARMIGWTAHALEEYREPGLRLRLTGVYTGARPRRQGSATAS